MAPTTEKCIDVVAGLILKDRRLLVCQRNADAAFPLKWEFPGGKVENGESDGDALRRELQEELGIQVQFMKQVFQHQHGYPNGPRVSLRFFAVYSYNGAIQNLVFQRITWASLTDLKRLEFLNGDRPLIDRLVADGGTALLGQPLIA